MSKLKEDLDALRAMAASRMSVKSIAGLLRRSEAWVERQLALLDASIDRAAANFARGVEAVLALALRFGRRAASLALRFARAVVGRGRKPREAAEGQGCLIERTFRVRGGSRGGAVRLGDGRLAFLDAITGAVAGQRIDVTAEPGRFFQVVEAPAL